MGSFYRETEKTKDEILSVYRAVTYRSGLSVIPHPRGRHLFTIHSKLCSNSLLKYSTNAYVACQSMNVEWATSGCIQLLAVLFIISLCFYLTSI